MSKVYRMDEYSYFKNLLLTNIFYACQHLMFEFKHLKINSITSIRKIYKIMINLMI